MSHQNPLQVSYTLVSVSGTVQRWFSKCWVRQCSCSPVQQMPELTVCSGRVQLYTAAQLLAQSGPSKAFERGFAAQIQSLNALLHPVPARTKPRPPFLPAVLTVPAVWGEAVRRHGGTYVPLTSIRYSLLNV